MTNNQIKTKFKESPAINKYHQIAWILPLMIGGSSLLLSIHQSNWEYFSRAGSLIVLVGVYIAYKDWSGDIYPIIKPDYFTMSEFLEIGNVDKLDEADRSDLKKKFQEIEEIHNQNRSFVRYASRRFRKMEANLVISWDTDLGVC